MNILRSLFDFEYKELRKFMKIADQIEAKSDEYEKLTDKQLQHKTEEFKKLHTKHINNNDFNNIIF